MTTFQTRALSAAVFGIVMMVGLFWNEWSFNILFAIITFGCAWEFAGMMITDGKLKQAKKVLIALVTLIFSLYYSFENILSQINIFSELSNVGDFFVFRFLKILLLPKLLGFNLLGFSSILVCSLFLILELFTVSEKPFHNIGTLLVSIFYIGSPFALLQGINYHNKAGGWTAYPPLSALPQANNDIVADFTPYIVAGMLFLTWANDSFAYIIGSRIGKTPLFPRISPKKTWEGTIGGGLMCMVTAGIIGLFFKELSTLNWVVIGGIVAVFGTLGDLVESMLKRSVGVKDSGSIMPGHGGFLDRFDAFMFVIPFVYAYLLLVR
jgi:phosphatidate cytidylyltransferase